MLQIVFIQSNLGYYHIYLILDLSVSSSCERLDIEPPCFSTNNFLMELLHTHIRSHFFTLVPIYFSQIELALRDFNFYSDGTPSKESQCTPVFAKTKENEKKKKKQKKNKSRKKKEK